MNKPTPEEKCSHDWNVVEYRSGIYRECSKCCKEELMNSPSPEARVDWEKEARRIVDKKFGVWSLTHKWKLFLIKHIVPALSAAFEKGREAR